MKRSRNFETPEPGADDRRVAWVFWLRLAVGLLLFAWILLSLPLLQLRTVMAESLYLWRWWLAALVFTFAGLWAGSLRWHRILLQHRFPATRRAVFRFFFFGQFFNSFLPGGCGGDLVRAYYATTWCGERKAEAACTVLVDRVIGLFVTILAGCVLILVRWPLFRGHGMLHMAAWFMLAILVAVSLAGYLLFRQHLFASSRRLDRWSRTRPGGLLKTVYEAFYLYRGRPWLLLPALCYSLVNLLMLALACYCFGRSLLIDLPWIDYLSLYPLITVLTAIPLTPGALGVREGLFVHLFAGLGVAAFRAVPLSLYVYADGLLWSLFGGMLFMMTPRASRLRAMEELSGTGGDIS